MKPILWKPKKRKKGSYEVLHLILDGKPKEKGWYSIYGTTLLEGRLILCTDCKELVLPDTYRRSGKKCSRCHFKEYDKREKRKNYRRDYMREYMQEYRKTKKSK